MRHKDCMRQKLMSIYQLQQAGCNTLSLGSPMAVIEKPRFVGAMLSAIKRRAIKPPHRLHLRWGKMGKCMQHKPNAIAGPSQAAGCEHRVQSSPKGARFCHCFARSKVGPVAKNVAVSCALSLRLLPQTGIIGHACSPC